jgi:hypothetical protein
VVITVIGHRRDQVDGEIENPVDPACGRRFMEPVRAYTAAAA